MESYVVWFVAALALLVDKLPVSEPQLLELITHHAKCLHFTNDLNQLAACQLIFIACDVPTDEKGNSDLTVIDDLIKKTCSVISDEASLIVLSQIPPGFTRKINLPKERLFYQVETLIFGQAVERSLYPERYIVGTNDPNSALPSAYLTLLSTFNCPILKMRYESAELAKIAINMFLVSSVSTTNTLAEICENIGADWQEIAPALRLDKRIGQHAYLTPGLGIAGGNLERDLNTVIKIGEIKTTETGVVSAWLRNSQYRRDWVLHCIQDQVLASIREPSICILGLAYKANTHSIKNSPSMALIEQLQKYKLVIHTHDPVVVDPYPVNSQATNKISTIFQKSTLNEALQDVDVVVIMTPWDHYRELTINVLQRHMRGKTIIDPYRVLKINPLHLSELGFNYFSLGQGAYQTMKHPASKELSYV